MREGEIAYGREHAVGTDDEIVTAFTAIGKVHVDAIIAVFERGAWFSAVRVRHDDDVVELKVFRNFAFDDAHQAVRAARTKAAAFEPRT